MKFYWSRTICKLFGFILGFTLIFVSSSCLEEESDSDSSISLLGPSAMGVLSGDMDTNTSDSTPSLAEAQSDKTNSEPALIFAEGGKSKMTKGELVLKLEEARVELTKLMVERSTLELKLEELKKKLEKKKKEREEGKKKLEEDMNRMGLYHGGTMKIM